MNAAHTIFALATPAGKSGVAVIRLSGAQSLAALKALTGIGAPSPRSAHYTAFRAPGGDIIDRGLTIYFPAPHSFTGEDVVELHIHGSLATMRQMLGTLAGIEGLKAAEPGEFSRRAFINGKMDLMEAEGLADLIDAETTAQKSQALRQMGGDLSAYYHELREKIIRTLAHLEAYIDFPDEEIPESVLAGLSDNIKSIQNVIKVAISDHKRGERLREGLSVVILGAPNTGKSSLLNNVAKRDAAIVSSRAGTTRDIIEVHMDIAGYPAVLVDTAGLRNTDDDIEGEGVRRALARAGEADIKIVLFDGNHWPKRDAASVRLLDANTIAVVNKCDLYNPVRSEDEAQDPARRKLPQDFHFISTKTGQGVDALLQEIERRIVSFFSGATAPFITRQRHRALLSEASMHLDKALPDAPLELKCEELRLAAQAVGKITGKIQVDDVLDVVFKQFCIGK